MSNIFRKYCFRGALGAGLIAILINTLLLYLADFIPLQTAHGGLLNLLTIWMGPGLQKIGIYNYWHGLGLPSPSGGIFKMGFHIAVGLGMALVYAFVVEPRVPGPAWIKGLLYAFILWLINAFFILPLIGEGIAGSRHLNFAGVTYYASAHTVFFVLLALLYKKFMNNNESARFRI